MSGPPLPRIGAVPNSLGGRWGGGTEIADEEDEDIYEVLPGMRTWLPHVKTHTYSHRYIHTDK